MESINNDENVDPCGVDIVPPCKCYSKLFAIIDTACDNETAKYNEETDSDNKIYINADMLQNLQLDGANIHLSFESKQLNKRILSSNIVEIYLDNVLSEKNDFLFPEIFKCANLQVLSLRKNNLLHLPADIGRLSQLRILILTENFLTDQSIPFTLTFCKYLTTLHLDHNFLKALPGFLLEMHNLETVYRHGNDNYFKSTFLWYHSSQRDRVLPYLAKKERILQPKSLQTCSIISLIGSKINFFQPGLLPVTLQEYISQSYFSYTICAFCSKAFCHGGRGYKVYTFQSPYLGNTCVPFQHWTCSRNCGDALQQSALQAERVQTREADIQYQQYVTSVQTQPHCSLPRQVKPKMSCSVM